MKTMSRLLAVLLFITVAAQATEYVEDFEPNSFDPYFNHAFTSDPPYWSLWDGHLVLNGGISDTVTFNTAPDEYVNWASVLVLQDLYRGTTVEFVGTLDSAVFTGLSSEAVDTNGLNLGEILSIRLRAELTTEVSMFDDVRIRVVPRNQPPSAEAGPGQTVTDSDRNGSEQVTLDGSGSSDPDGTIDTYVWTEGTTQIGTGVGPTVTLGVGTHTITLTVTDDDGAPDTDTVVITVESPANIVPTADAGPDQTVVDTDDDGSEQVALDGSGSNDPDGTIQSYVWTDGTSQIATGINPSVSLTVGVHTILLTVTDDDEATGTDSVVITIESPPNVAPTADAGPDRVILDQDDSGQETVVLDASGSADSDGSIVGYNWTEGTRWLAYSTNAWLDLTLSVGTHTLTLTVTDNEGATDTDSVVITVESPPNVPPVADAGPDQLFTDQLYGYTFVRLDGSGSYDPDGTIVSYRWTQDGVTFVSGRSPRVTLGLGVHTFTLEVTDNDGVTGTDTVVIDIQGAQNQPPTADAGPDQYVDFGRARVLLQGTGQDTEGPVQCLWSQVAGTPVQIFNPATAAQAWFAPPKKVESLRFRLLVEDSVGATATDEIVVTVFEDLGQGPYAHGNAIFVSDTFGDDTGDGSMSYPFKTLERAMSMPIDLPADVYVDHDTYTPRETLLRRNGRSVYGGFEAVLQPPGSEPRLAWTRTGGATEVLSQKAIALRVEGVSSPTVVDGLTIKSGNGSFSGANSIGIMVQQCSSDLTISNNQITAGRGADGADMPKGKNGMSGTDFVEYSDGRASDGMDDNVVGTTITIVSTPSSNIGVYDDESEAWLFIDVCPPPVRYKYAGGVCGAGGSYPRWDGRDGCPPGRGGSGGTAHSDNLRGQSNGRPGFDGPDATFAGLGGRGGSAETAWFNSNRGLYGDSGSSGTRGDHGTGGGGGGGGGGQYGRWISSLSSNRYDPPGMGASGGRGGWGGTGGFGGKGGPGGGHSIGILLWQSDPVIVDNTVSTTGGGTGGNGGEGGDGGYGALGQEGGKGSDQVGDGGDGGNGGFGAGGGGGGGGAGGMSCGIYKGGSSLPVIVNTLIEVGPAGAAGRGGEGGYTFGRYLHDYIYPRYEYFTNHDLCGKRGKNGEPGLRMLTGPSCWSAAAPTIFTQVAQGAQQSHEVTVSSSANTVEFDIDWGDGSYIEATVVSPSGERTYLGYASALTHTASGPIAGLWRVELYGSRVLTPDPGVEVTISVTECVPGEVMESVMVARARVYPAMAATNQTYRIGDDVRRTTFTSTWGGSDVEMTLITPSGRTIARDVNDPDVTHVLGPTYESYAVRQPEPGDWTVQLFGADVPEEGEDVTLEVVQPLPNQAPVTDAGPEQTVECVRPTGAPVRLDGSASHDPDGDALVFEWHDQAGNMVGTGPSVDLTPPVGVHLFTLTVNDGSGGTDVNTVTVTVEDTIKPRVTLKGPRLMTLVRGVDTYVEQGAGALDLCDGELSTTTGGDVVDASTAGEYVVTYRAVDASGNEAVEQRRIAVLDDGCFPPDHPDYDDWVALGRPPCWCAPPHGNGYQCQGDVDGERETAEGYQVYTQDLERVIANWQKTIDDPTLDPCADIDHQSETVFEYRVYMNDLAILVGHWMSQPTDAWGGCGYPLWDQ